MLRRHNHAIPGFHFARDNLLCKPILDFILNLATKRSCTVLSVVCLLHNICLGSVTDHKFDLQLLPAAFLQFRCHQRYDLLHIILVECAEYDRLIDSV